MSEVELGRVSPLGLGTIPHGDISRYTGLELLQRIIDNKYPAPPISFQLSFDLIEVSKDARCSAACRTSAISIRWLGAWRLGRDAAGFGSCLRGANAAREGRGLYDGGVQGEPDTADHAKTGEVVCEGRVVHKGRTLAVSEATLKDANGKLLAFGTETCSIFPAANLAAR
jgi:hypothetical protein